MVFNFIVQLVFQSIVVDAFGLIEKSVCNAAQVFLPFSLCVCVCSTLSAVAKSTFHISDIASRIVMKIRASELKSSYMN